MKNCVYKYSTLLLLTIIVLCYSCKKIETYYVGPKGELKGIVVLNDGDSILKDWSGVKVYADGSNPFVQTVTDKQGNFTLKDLTTGIYDIVFQKDGYCTSKLTSYQFVGGNEPMITYDIQLFKIPNGHISSLEVVHKGSWEINATVSPVNTDLRFYFGDSPNVSYKHYLTQARWSMYGGYSYLILGDNTKVMNELYSQNARTIYLVAYPCVTYDWSYLDLATGNDIYFVNTSSPSNVVSFTLPN